MNLAFAEWMALAQTILQALAVLVGGGWLLASQRQSQSQKIVPDRRPPRGFGDGDFREAGGEGRRD